VDAEGITVGDDSLLLIARDAEGSMRDAQSKLDQVLAFTGKVITADDVATVLGLVGRDLLIDTVQAVADEDAPAAFALAARAVDMGYDLRAVCRELSRIVRDLLVLSVDPSRISDPEIATEGERDRLKALAGRYSREDLLRAFDLLTRAETDVRTAAQPRYHLEMALLRWIYLRKIVPIEDLIAGTSSGSDGGPKRPALRPPSPPAPPAAVAPRSVAPGTPAPSTKALSTVAPSTPALSTASPGFKDALLGEIRKAKAVFYNMVVAQAQKIEVAGDRVTFTFAPNQRALRDQFEQNRGWLESVGQQVAGRRIVFVAQSEAPGEIVQTGPDRKTVLREQALADAGVQTLLEVFPAEIRDVEEM
jgi:DNA polymerase-3 subunit gamma/tau